MDVLDEFSDAIEIIRKFYKGPIRPYMTVDFGRRKKHSAISLVPPIPPPMNSMRLLETLHDELPEGYIAFYGNNRWLGEEKFNGSELVVARSFSQLFSINLAETSGLNQDLSTQEIINTLEELDRDYRLWIQTATNDSIVFRLDRYPQDIHIFLEDLGTRLKAPFEPRGAVIREIEKTGLIGIWWD